MIGAVVARALFYPSLAYNVLMSQVTSRCWYNRLDDCVVLGALPLKGVANKLIEEEKIKAVVSMNEEYELKHIYTMQEWADQGVEQLHLSVVDMTATPSRDKLYRAVDFILTHKQQGHSVYVHCKAGRTRSATVAVCYLMRTNQWRPEEAVSFVKSVRPHIWLREKHLNSVQDYYSNIVKPGM